MVNQSDDFWTEYQAIKKENYRQFRGKYGTEFARRDRLQGRSRWVR